MFKKIEIWILYLTILLGVLFAIGFGVFVRQELVGNIKAGWISKTALTLVEMPLNIRRVFFDEKENVFKNANFVKDRFPALDGFVGRPNSEESYLLLSRFDGDLTEGVVELVNLTNFEVLHTWNPDIDVINDLVKHVDEFNNLDRDLNNSRTLLEHPKLTKNGGLLFHYYSPLIKIDACSQLLSQNTHDKFHHSLETDIDGNIWVPSKLNPQSIPRIMIGVGENLNKETRYYHDDAIVKLSSDGEILFEKSVSQIFIDNGLEYLLFSVGNAFNLDPIHLNDIQPVNFDGEFWKKGDVFLSLRHQSMVLLYRPSTNEIIWKGTGAFFYQHDVDILDNHRISIFNNNSKNFADGNVVDGHNEVIIYDFETNEYSSYLKVSLANNEVRTSSNGRSEILPNGDLLIEETVHGRTLYFNADGVLRWTHVNRAENGKVYRVGWSRVLYKEEDIKTVHKFLDNRGTCNE